MLGFKDDRNIRNSSIIQVVLVIRYFFIQSADLMRWKLKFIDFMWIIFRNIRLCLILTLIFIIAAYQKLWVYRDNNDAKYHFVLWIGF